MTQPWYPFYWSDYSGKTMHLTMAQHGAFIMFLRWIYTTGKAIPDKQRYSIARALLEQERSDADFVLSEFFELINEQWSNKTACEVMQDAEKLIKKRKEAGALGGKQRSSNAQAQLKQSLTTQTHTQNHINNNPLPKEDGRVINFNSREGVCLKEQTISDAKNILPRADIYSIESEWKGKQDDPPKNPDAAFLGYCKKYAVNHPELTIRNAWD